MIFVSVESFLSSIIKLPFNSLAFSPVLIDLRTTPIFAVFYEKKKSRVKNIWGEN